MHAGGKFRNGNSPIDCTTERLAAPSRARMPSRPAGRGRGEKRAGAPIPQLDALGEAPAGHRVREGPLQPADQQEAAVGRGRERAVQARRPQAAHLAAAHLRGRLPAYGALWCSLPTRRGEPRRRTSPLPTCARCAPGQDPLRSAHLLLVRPRATYACRLAGRARAAPARRARRRALGRRHRGLSTRRPTAARAPLPYPGPASAGAQHGHAAVGVHERGAHRDQHQLRGHVVLEERLVVRAGQQVRVCPRLHAARGRVIAPEAYARSAELPGRHMFWHIVAQPAGCSTNCPHSRCVAAQGRPARKGVNLPAPGWCGRRCCPGCWARWARAGAGAAGRGPPAPPARRWCRRPPTRSCGAPSPIESVRDGGQRARAAARATGHVGSARNGGQRARAAARATGHVGPPATAASRAGLQRAPQSTWGSARDGCQWARAAARNAGRRGGAPGGRARNSSNTALRPSSGERSRQRAAPVAASATHSASGCRGGSRGPPACSRAEILPGQIFFQSVRHVRMAP